MNNDIFKSLYNDFFGIEKIKKENEKLAKELGIDENNIPEIVLNKEQNNDIINTEKNISEEELKKIKDNKMSALFEKLESLYITDESKNMLKKIIEYMRKYNEKIEKEYIQFNLSIYSDNKETISSIIDIIGTASKLFSYVKAGDIVQVTFYNLEKVDQIKDIFNKENSIICFKDFEAFVKKDDEYKDKFLYNLEEEITNNENSYLNIIIAKNKELIDSIFENNINLKEKLCNFEIVGIKPDIQDVYQEILNKLQENNEIDENFSVKLLDYITATYVKTELSYPEYRDKLCEKIIFNKLEKITENDLPEYEKEKTNGEIFAELNELVGLSEVKKVLTDLVNLLELKDKAGEELSIKNTNLHMVFLGNPGTGKTTVARIISGILYNLKYIKQNKLIEVSSKDLVAEYVGQTAPKTNEVIQKALGGVLFIDEAYSLASGKGQGNSYNEEAIATLIQGMENYRDNLVVIFAGYTKEMQDFLNANSGIVSRIGYTLEFADYTEIELLQIFKNMIKKSGFIITKEAEDEVLKIIKEYKDTENFGNARFVRSLYEKTIIKHASNTKGKKGKKILKTIEKQDISAENLLKM